MSPISYTSISWLCLWESPWGSHSEFIFSLVHTVLVNSGIKFLILEYIRSRRFSGWRQKKLMQMCIGIDAAAESEDSEKTWSCNLKLQSRVILSRFIWSDAIIWLEWRPILMLLIKILIWQATKHRYPWLCSVWQNWN